MAKVRAYEAHLDLEIAAKNCGTGAGGFHAGNTCGQGGGAAGRKRRQKAGRNRRRQGPSTGVGANSRARARQKRGAHRNSRREWEGRIKVGHETPDHRIMRDDHAEARRDLAGDIRNERADLRETHQSDRRDLARSIRAERTEGRSEQRRDRRSMARRQKHEVGQLEAAQSRQMTRLDAHHAGQRSRSTKPEKHAEKHAAERERIAESHREGLDELRDTHRSERADLIGEQRTARQDDRDSHREQITDLRSSQRSDRHGQHVEQRTQIHDLHKEHRKERADLYREEAGSPPRKAYSFVNVKATPDADGVPSAQAILDAVLDELGHAEAWADGSLDGMTRLEVLHEVRLAGRRWFRAEAQAVLDELSGVAEKALFGKAKVVVGAFFDRATKYVREIIAAGLIAVAGPGPMIQQEAILEAYDQQVAIQVEYLDDFRKQVLAGSPPAIAIPAGSAAPTPTSGNPPAAPASAPMNGTFVSRAEMYGNAAWSAPQQIVRQAVSSLAIFDEEMREHLGEDTPCSTCAHQAAMGWQPIGTLRAIGDSICMSGCHCRFLFRKGNGGVPHIAGRGPLFDAAFGVDGKALGLIDWEAFLKAFTPCRDASGRFASCGGSAGQTKPKPGVKPESGSGGGKKPRKPKEPAAAKPKVPKPKKEPSKPKETKPPKGGKKPTEKPATKPVKEKPPKTEKPGKPEADKPSPGPKPLASPPSSVHTTGTPILPDRPMAERIDAYAKAGGNAKLEQLISLGNDVDRLKSRHQDAEIAYHDAKSKMKTNDFLDNASAKGVARREALKKLNEERWNLSRERDAAEETLAARATKFLELPSDESIKIKSGVSKLQGSPVAAQVDRVSSQLGSWVRKGEGRGVEAHWEPVPQGEGQRAFHRGVAAGGNNVSKLGATAGIQDKIIAHELGHAIEWQVPGVHEATQDFLKHRCGDEPMTTLRDIYPNSGYRPDEAGRKDDFGKVFDGPSAYYVGKTYKASAKNSEVLSMGIEALHSDPVGFATKDPEFAMFTLGCLDGSLRRPKK